MAKIKRALALSGGGPLVGIEIGAIHAFIDSDIEFDVWTCDCIGSWVACVFNSIDKQKDKKTKRKMLEDFFNILFVDDDIYELFPVATNVFVLNYLDYMEKIIETNASMFFNLSNFYNLYKPKWTYNLLFEYLSSFPHNQAEQNIYIGKFMSINPFFRYIMSNFWRLHKSGMGLSSVKEMPTYWNEYLDFDKLNSLVEEQGTYIYINAYNLTKQKIELFSNDKRIRNKKNSNFLRVEALQAGSSVLFYVENPLIDGDRYCEGANVDTVNFKDLLKNHKDIDEIWVIAITDYKFVKPPNDLREAADLQVMLPFSTIAADDIKLFEYYKKDPEKIKELGITKEEANKINLIKINIDGKDISNKMNYSWNKTNFRNGIQLGYEAAMTIIKSKDK
jgi:predicted acylesterase/phospholipase RssA